MSLAIVRALAPSRCAFEVADDSDFPLEFSGVTSEDGTPWGHISYLRVTGAGAITVEFAEPREGHPAEAFTMEEGDELAGQITKITTAAAACFPIKVFR